MKKLIKYINKTLLIINRDEVKVAEDRAKGFWNIRKEVAEKELAGK